MVHPDDDGGRPAVGKHAGDVAAAAPEVVDAGRVCQRDPPHEVHGGPQAVVGELEVLPGIPRVSGDVACVRRGVGRVRAVGAHGQSQSNRMLIQPAVPSSTFW